MSFGKYPPMATYEPILLRRRGDAARLRRIGWNRLVARLAQPTRPVVRT